MAALTFKPVTKATKADFEALFDGPGGPKNCWCMVWRATPEEGRGTGGEVRKQQMLGRIDRNLPVGLIGYAEGRPVAWVSIAPKQTYRRLGGPEPEEDEKIWSLACMYLRRQFRGQGLGHELIKAAVGQARKNGATAVEAYPVAPDAPSYRFMGFVPAFEQAGFEEIGTAGTRRHVMRLTLSQGTAPKG
ncbi:MAG: GNAT family N-acetyltransferase [Devosia sp.]